MSDTGGYFNKVEPVILFYMKRGALLTLLVFCSPSKNVVVHFVLTGFESFTSKLIHADFSHLLFILITELKQRSRDMKFSFEIYPSVTFKLICSKGQLCNISEFDGIISLSTTCSRDR